MRTTSILAGVLGLLLSSPIAVRAGAPAGAGTRDALIPRAELFAPADRSGVTISPDARFIAYLRRTDDGRALVVAPVSSPDEPAWTSEPGASVRSYRWTFVPDRLVCVTSRGDAGGSLTLTTTDVSSGESGAIFDVRGAAMAIEAMSSDLPRRAIVSVLDAPGSARRYVEIDLVSGRHRPVMHGKRFVQVFFDADLSPAAATVVESDGTIVVRNLLPDGPADLLRVDPADLITTRVLGVTADASRLILLDSADRPCVALSTIDIATGVQRVHASDTGSDITEVLLDGATGEPVGAASGAAQRWQGLDPRVSSMLESIQSHTSDAFSVVSRSLDERAWIVRFTPETGPARFALATPGDVSPLFGERETEPAWHAQPSVAFEVQTDDDLRIPCRYTLPARSPGMPPCVVLVHDGPWSRDAEGFDPVRAWLADRGYCVLQVSFRGSTGLGRALLDAGDHQWSARIHDDILDAVAYLADRRIIDRDRVGIMGTGFGGYEALVGLTFTPYSFACAVSIEGFTDLRAMLRRVPEGAPALGAMLHRRVGDPDNPKDASRLKAQSPVTFAHRRVRPLFMAMGDADRRSMGAEVRAFIARTMDRGAPLTVAALPAGAGAPYTTEQSLPLLAEIEAFLADTLGGASEPASAGATALRMATLDASSLAGVATDE